MKTVSVDSWLAQKRTLAMKDAELAFYKNQAEAMASEIETMVAALKRGEGVIIDGMTIIRAEPPVTSG